MQAFIAHVVLGLCTILPVCSDQTYVDTFLVERISAAMMAYLSAPVELVDLTLAAYDMQSIETTEELREWIYAQVKSMTASSGGGCNSQVVFTYAGLEDGTFVGYYNTQSVSFRSPHRSRADALGTAWAPHTFGTISNASDVDTPSGRRIGTGCFEDTVYEQCSAGSNYGCDNTGCCYSNIRTYHSTRPALRGQPDTVNRWATYDHRCRPWYTEQLQDVVSSRWSSVYETVPNECSAGNASDLVITRTGILRFDIDPSPRGVYAIDFRLDGVSQLLSESLAGMNTWAYIVERDSEYLIGITTGEPLVIRNGTEEIRTTPRTSSSASIVQSLEAYRHLDWNATSISNARFEAALKRFTYAGTDWILVVGQDIHCAANEIWKFGVCERCPPGQVPVSDRECHSCNMTQKPDAGQQGCICPTGTYAEHAGSAVRCRECSSLRDHISSFSMRAKASEWADVCPGGTTNVTAVCPLTGLWVHLVGQPAHGVELHPCPACISEDGANSSSCSATSQSYEAGWFQLERPPKEASFTALCQPTHQDFLCARCIAGYSKIDGQCVECSSIRWTWVLLELGYVVAMAEAILRTKIMKVYIPPREALQVFNSVDRGGKGYLDKDDVSNLLIRVGAPTRTAKELWDIVMLMGAREKYPDKEFVTLRSLPFVPVALGGLRRSASSIDKDLALTRISRNQFIEWCRHTESHDRFGMLVFFVQTLGLVAKTSPALQAAFGWFVNEVLDVLNLQLSGNAAAVECSLPWCGQHPLTCRVASVVLSPILIICVIVFRIWWLAQGKLGSPGLPMRWFHLQRSFLIIFRLTYAPITRTCVSIMFGCRDVVYETRWIEDLSVRCYVGNHLVLVWISAVAFVCMGILVPAGMLVRARSVQMQHKRTTEATPLACTKSFCGCLDKVLHNSNEDASRNLVHKGGEDYVVLKAGPVSKRNGGIVCTRNFAHCRDDLWLVLRASGILAYYSSQPVSDAVQDDWRGIIDVREIALVYGRGSTGLVIRTQENAMHSQPIVERDWHFYCLPGKSKGAKQQRDEWIQEINLCRRNLRDTESSFHPNALFPRCWDDLSMSVRPQRYYWFVVILSLKLFINILYLLGETEKIGFLTCLQILLCFAALLAHFAKPQIRKMDNRLEQLTYLCLVMITIFIRDPVFELQSSTSLALGIVLVIVCNLVFVLYTGWHAQQMKQVHATRIRQARHQAADTHFSIILAKAVPTFLLLNEEAQEHIAGRLQLEGWPAGAVIYEEGDVASAIYIIQDGHVQLSSAGHESNRRLQTAELGPGCWFGADALAPQPGNYRADARALESLVCIRLVKADFDRFWGKEASIGSAVDDIFANVDSDCSNFLDREELKAYIYSLETIRVYTGQGDKEKEAISVMIDGLIDSLDKNGDGQIARKELRAHICKLPQSDTQLLVGNRRHFREATNRQLTVRTANPRVSPPNVDLLPGHHEEVPGSTLSADGCTINPLSGSVRGWPQKSQHRASTVKRLGAVQPASSRSIPNVGRGSQEPTRQRPTVHGHSTSKRRKHPPALHVLRPQTAVQATMAAHSSDEVQLPFRMRGHAVAPQKPNLVQMEME